MAIDFTASDENKLSRRERLMLQQERQRDFEHQRYMAAQQRAFDRDRWFAMKNPNAVSPQTYRQLVGDQEQERVREHERNLLETKNKGLEDVEMLRAEGLRSNGSAAAEQNRLAKEAEWRGRKEIADMETTAQREANKTVHGYFDSNGTYHEGSSILTERERQLGEQKRHEQEWGSINQDGTRTPGGRESVAQIEGKAKVDAAKAQAEAAAQEAATKRALEEQKIRAAQEKDKARLKYNYDRLEAKDRANVDTQANALAREKGISFEDARDQIMASREQAAQQGGKKEVKRQRNPTTGEIRIVYDDGSTEIVKG